MVLKKSSGSGFVYKRRPASSVKKRENQSGSSREGFINPEIKIWTPSSGLNRVRILPPTWENAGHFGLDVWVHYAVGVDQNAYLCLKKNGDIIDSEECPCCEQRLRFQQDDNQDAADALRERKRVLVYMIDRDNEHNGVQLWSMPFTVDRELATVCQDEETNEVYFIDDPDEGYDIKLRREGQGQTTKYATPALGREPKPLSRSKAQAKEWLDWIAENPIPDQLIIAEAEDIEEAIGTNPSGKPTRRDDKLKTKGRRGAEEEDEDEPPPRRKGRARAKDDDEDEEEDDRRGARSRRKRDDDEDEDEAPVTRRRRARDDDDDEDEDERPISRRRKAGVDDEEDEEEALRGTKRKKLTRSRDEEDDDDPDPDADDEEETPSRGRTVKSRSRVSRKSDPDEDEDDEGEEEEKTTRTGRVTAKVKTRRADPDDDEDDEPPPKTKVGATTVRSKLGKLRR